MSTPNEKAAGEHSPIVFPRYENQEGGWALQYDMLVSIASEVTASGWMVGIEEVEMVLLAAEKFLADTPQPSAPTTSTELYRARMQAAAWLLVADATSRDLQAMQASLRHVVSWCEDPTNRTQHTLRQQCALLDALHKRVKAALDLVPEEPREPAVVEVSLLGDTEFRALLDLFMCSDPWPIHNGQKQNGVLEALVNQEARRRGYTDWPEAYHRFEHAQEGGA